MTDNEPTDDKRDVSIQPKQIGSYRVLDMLGEGGMAEVFLAEQSHPVKRRVALKILKAGMDSKQVVARFESERQALAVLDHPNIAKIFDGGVAENGRPYFAMELFKGVPITDYCDDQRLDNKARIGLFIDVCAAVQHAHLKGLIHRDLKPSNILVGVVDGKPQPKIIDFGIAKATTTTLTESTLYTKVGQIIGTPQYMSPEQAGVTGLDVDTRTDIYSLGVILYELLVGVPPLDLVGIGDQAMQIALKEKDPPKPSTRLTQLDDTKDEVAKVRGMNPEGLKRQLSGDLDWVVMKAIEKDRTRRYDTANALAMECKRYLGREPVLARPPSPGYLLRRFVQRNKLIVIAGSVAVLAIVFGAVTATTGYLRATEAERVALQEAETARQVSGFLVDLFQVSDPWSFAPVRDVSGTSITAREVLDMGANRIRSELNDQPVVQASLMNAIGGVFLGLDALDESEAMLLEGLAIREKEFAANSPQVAESLMNLGRLYYLKGDYAESAVRFDQSARIYEAIGGGYRLQLAQTLGGLSVTLSNKGDLREALEVQMLAIEILDELGITDPLQRGLQVNNLGHIYHLLGELQNGIETFEEAVELFDQTTARGYHASALGNLAAMYQVSGRLSDARRMHEQALELKREWFGPTHIEVGYGIANLSMVYLNLYDFERAAELQSEAIDIFSAALGPDHPNVSIIRGNLAWSLKGQGDIENAEQVFHDALRGIRETLGAGHLNLTNLYNGLGEMYAEQGDYETAERWYRETLIITEESSPRYNEAGVAFAGIAALPESTLSAIEREEYFLLALELLEEGEGLATPRGALMEIEFASFLVKQNQAEQARQYFDSGLEHLAAALPTDNWKYQEQVERYEANFN